MTHEAGRAWLRETQEGSWSCIAPSLEGKGFSEYLGGLLTNGGVAIRHVAEGDSVFEEGEDGDCAYVIDRGVVSITARGPEEEPRVLAVLGPGELFGEMAVLDRPRRSATAVARENTRLFVLPREDMVSLVSRIPKAALWLLNVMARRLARTNRLLASMEHLNEVNLKILSAREEERRRVGRDLHDGPAQCFADYIMRLQIIERLIPSKMDAAFEELRLLRQSLNDGLGKVREVIYGLHPKELTQSGLVGALEQFAERIMKPSGIVVEIMDTVSEEVLREEIEASLYCILQEALNNVRRHAKASKVVISFEREDEHILTIRVQDDGCGFDVKSLMKNYSSGQSYGLSSMDERMTLAGGRMAVQSSPGKGTTLTFRLPLARS